MSSPSHDSTTSSSSTEPACFRSHSSRLARHQEVGSSTHLGVLVVVLLYLCAPLSLRPTTVGECSVSDERGSCSTRLAINCRACWQRGPSPRDIESMVDGKRGAGGNFLKPDQAVLASAREWTTVVKRDVEARSLVRALTSLSTTLERAPTRSGVQPVGSAVEMKVGRHNVMASSCVDPLLTRLSRAAND